MSEEETKCGCKSGNCGCEGKSCGCGDGCDCGEANCSSSECGDSCCAEDAMPKMMMGLANQAWAELLKEKMKRQYEATTGKRLDAVAKVSVDACLAHWDGKMQQKEQFEEFARKLSEAMSS